MTADQHENVRRRVARIRHAHEAGKIDGLRDQMLFDGTVCLEVEKVFSDLSQLKDFAFLEELSVRQLKRGIASIGNLQRLTKLSLWEIRALTSPLLNRSRHCKHCIATE